MIFTNLLTTFTIVLNSKTYSISPMCLAAHPADPTLTTDNLMEVVKEMECHWQDLCDKLGLQSDDALGMADMVNNYVRHHPTPSWKEVARALQELELHELADTVTTKYVKGKGVDHVTCLVSNQVLDDYVWYLLISSQ